MPSTRPSATLRRAAAGAPHTRAPSSTCAAPGCRCPPQSAGAPPPSAAGGSTGREAQLGGKRLTGRVRQAAAGQAAPPPLHVARQCPASPHLHRPLVVPPLARGQRHAIERKGPPAPCPTGAAATELVQPAGTACLPLPPLPASACFHPAPDALCEVMEVLAITIGVALPVRLADAQAAAARMGAELAGTGVSRHRSRPLQAWAVWAQQGTRRRTTSAPRQWPRPAGGRRCGPGPACHAQLRAQG